MGFGPDNLGSTEDRGAGCGGAPWRQMSAEEVWCQLSCHHRFVRYLSVDLFGYLEFLNNNERKTFPGQSQPASLVLGLTERTKA